MAGTILEAAAHRLPTVIDGFIATAAAAVAFLMEPACREFCFFAHRSDERAHGAVLAALGADPLIDLGMRLGEGTGAALAMHIIDAAAKIMCEMATFESAGVSGPAENVRK
jgi:nicotinate-nucleotide--dimethylbenzimidazole phosphoribosyltransferase